MNHVFSHVVDELSGSNSSSCLDGELTVRGPLSDPQTFEMLLF